MYVYMYMYVSVHSCETDDVTYMLSAVCVTTADDALNVAENYVVRCITAS